MKHLAFLLIIIISGPSFADDVLHAPDFHLGSGMETGLDPDWSLISDRHGIQVFRRHQDDSRLKTFRGVTQMRLTDEYALAAVLNDYASIPRWLHFVDSAVELQRDSPLQRYLRFTTELPWPLKDRDAVVRARVVEVVTPEEESVTIYINNWPGLLAINPDYIRFPQMEGMLKLSRLQEGKVEVVYQLVVDPGGYIPVWLVNLLVRDAPYYTLKKLKNVIREPQYQGAFYSYIELKGPGRPNHLMPARSYIYGNPPEFPIPDGLAPGERNPPKQ